MLAIFVLASLLFGSNSKSTVYDLFSAGDVLNSMPHETLKVKVNGQDMTLVIGKQRDQGALLSNVRTYRFLPFYRDKNGGLSVHVNSGIDRNALMAPGSLMALIEPVLGFSNGSSTTYASLRVQRGFDVQRFLDTSIHDSEDLPVYPSAEKINTIETKRFSIGHYKTQATVQAVLVYYDSRLRSSGYKKLREAQGMALYRSGARLMIINAEEESNYVSIITYAVKEQ